jgi:hypothetical protein
MQKPPEDAPGMHFGPLYFADGRLPYTEISQDCRPQHFRDSLSAPSLCKHGQQSCYATLGFEKRFDPRVQNGSPDEIHP